MQRKIIQHSATSLGISLPAKWAKSCGLKKGDIIDVHQEGGKLEIQPAGNKPRHMETTINVADSRESAVRTALVNAYRAGFDRLSLSFAGSPCMIRQITERHLIGFEEISSGVHKYIIESVSEPGSDNFESMLARQLFMVEEMIGTMCSADLEEAAIRMQRYDNFLKRCISKGAFSSGAEPLLWQFISSVTQVSRCCLHFSRYIRRNGLSIVKDRKCISVINDIKGMAGLLRASYLKMDAGSLHRLHEMEGKISASDAIERISREMPLVMHHLLLITRMVYLANSPLTGFIQIKGMQRHEAYTKSHKFLISDL